MKIVYDKDKGCWKGFHEKEGFLIPNWTPDEVKFNKNIVVTNQDWLNNLFKLKRKTGKNMLNEEQNEVIKKQLTERLDSLYCRKDNTVRELARMGTRLSEVLDEIEKIEDVLGMMRESEDDKT